MVDANSAEKALESQKDDKKPRMKKAKVSKVECLADFIKDAYSRKGKKVALKPSVERQLAAQSPWSGQQQEETLRLAEGDRAIAVPRQLLLASRRIQGYPALRGAIREFVRDALLRHPVFNSASLDAAVRNLDHSPSLADALMELAGARFEATSGWPEWARPSRKSFRDLVINASGALALWYCESRGMTLSEVIDALAKTAWRMPSAKGDAPDEALRLITEMREPLALGVVHTELRDALRRARDEMLAAREAEALLRAELEGVRSELASSIDRIREIEDASRLQLEELRARAASLQSKLAHTLQDLASLKGRSAAFLRSEARNLEDVLVTLNRNPPLTDTAIDYVERSVEKLRKEIENFEEGNQ